MKNLLFALVSLTISIPALAQNPPPISCGNGLFTISEAQSQGMTHFIWNIQSDLLKKLVQNHIIVLPGGSIPATQTYSTGKNFTLNGSSATVDSGDAYRYISATMTVVQSRADVNTDSSYDIGLYKNGNGGISFKAIKRQSRQAAFEYPFTAGCTLSSQVGNLTWN